MFENSADWLLPGSLAESEEGLRPALRFEGESISYGRLLALTHQAASFLSAQGLGRRECVALILQDRPLFVSAFLGAMKLGAVPALISTFVEAKDLEHILNLCSARLVLAETEFQRALLEIRARVSSLKRIFVTPDAKPLDARVSVFQEDAAGLASPIPLTHTTSEDPAFLLFTSGSTGLPKAVVHHHADIRGTVENYGRQVLGLTSEDKVFSSSRLFFAYGLGNSLSFSLAARATTFLCREKPTPEIISQILRKERPTVFFSVPAVYRALLEYHRQRERLNTASLRMCVSAGEALPASVFTEWKETFGLEILDGIGTTEALHMFISNRRGKARAGSSGQVVEGYQVRIVDDAGEDVERGRTGHLMVKGNTFGPYYRSEEGFRPVAPSDWVRTGDMFRCDEEGYYYFCGRSDDHFKVQGLWVAPLEIEDALLAHEAVLEAGVVPMLDDHHLLRPRAFVVVRENRSVSAAALMEFLHSRLHSYQLPSEIVFVEKLPRTATGKLQRYKLRTLRSDQA